MTTLSRSARFERFDDFWRRDAVIRNAWGDGVERACLLHALVPEVGAHGEVSRCPAEFMPPWLAELTPAIDDRVSDGRWRELVTRLVAALRGADLDDAAWERVEYGFRGDCVREAMRHTKDERVLRSCREVVALCDRVAAGERRAGLGAEFEAAREAAAWAAAWAADAAADAAAWAAAWAADAAAAAAWAADAAAAAAWDRLAERLCERIEGRERTWE